MGFAARYFSGDSEQTLLRRISPTTAQREHLQLQWNSLVDYLTPALEAAHGYQISTWLQGSYKYGTLIRPIGLQREYDVDVGVYFSWLSGSAPTPSPAQIRDWVQLMLYRYRTTCLAIRSIEDPPLPRCHRIRYTKQLHIDVPVYHLDPGTDSRNLAHLEDHWEASDPKALYGWFKAVIPSGELDRLKRQVKYLKAWAAIAYDSSDTASPTSVVLTVLVAEAFKQLIDERRAPSEDDDLFASIVTVIWERLQETQQVVNPVDNGEDLNRLSHEDKLALVRRFDDLESICTAASESGDEAACCLAWDEAFSFLMPLPESSEIEVLEQETGTAVLHIPDIDVDVYSRNPKTFLGRYRNEVPGVYKKCDLYFTIADQHLLPDYASIEWTVRNENAEAEEANDIGHTTAGMGLITNHESTEYAGRHFLDCVIRAHGSVYAVRRVPVEVIGAVRPSRNAMHKAQYRKLSTRRGRRRR